MEAVENAGKALRTTNDNDLSLMSADGAENMCCMSEKQYLGNHLSEQKKAHFLLYIFNEFFI